MLMYIYHNMHIYAVLPLLYFLLFATLHFQIPIKIANSSLCFFLVLKARISYIIRASCYQLYITNCFTSSISIKISCFSANWLYQNSATLHVINKLIPGGFAVTCYSPQYVARDQANIFQESSSTSSTRFTGVLS